MIKNNGSYTIYKQYPFFRLFLNLLVYFIILQALEKMICFKKMTSNNDSIGLKYQEEAKHVFENWKQSGNSGLISETFFACTQSIGAIPELVK